MNVRGEIPYVYFYRVLGFDDQLQYLDEVIQLDQQLNTLGNYIRFEQVIHLTTDLAIIERVRKLFEPVPLKDFRNGALLNFLESQGYFSLSSDKGINHKVKESFSNMLELYLSNEKSANLSIAVNFMTKVILWFGEYGKILAQKSAHNPKLIYWGNPKTHEIYFLILMSRIGCDVLVLNSSFSDSFERIDKKNEWSFCIKNSKEQPLGPFPTKRSQQQSETNSKLSQESVVRNDKNSYELLNSQLMNDHMIVVNLKRTENPFKETLVPLNKRSGYVGGPYPIIPTYFIRYIGATHTSDDWEAEYYNSLYNLDMAFQKSGSYLKFLEGIPAPNAEESSWIPHRLQKHSYHETQEILERFLEDNLLHRTRVELLDNTIKRSFIDQVTLFSEKNSMVNVSIVFNFSLKLLTWINRYLPKLFDESMLDSKEESGEGFYSGRNPKILYYGTIKPHEIYLLSFFHQIGCDVLYIDSEEEGDEPFQRIDKEQGFTHLVQNVHNLSKAPFPLGERMIRKSTVAYNASKEIEEVIYSEEVGLFKPWQFESYSTQPITLKTTYDELQILWKESAKLRPEFKVQNKKVYVPNIFAKVNGVYETVATYWQEIKALSTAPNTKLIEEVPFTKTPYTKQDLYQAGYLLNDQGLFDEQRVMKSQYYKFGYMKAPLQHFLIVKINELLSSGVFVANVDEQFKLKILMTILTMDDALLKLIEAFDYPQEIPKVIVYDNDKESFNESDGIILAFMNLVGIDVVLYTPTNYRTIEQYIKSNLYDVHQLPLVKYDLILPDLANILGTSTNKPGLLSRFFKLR